MKRAHLWPIGVVACLALSMAANIGFMVVANDDPAFAVEPDYYRKAVEFDSTMARIRASQALGWHLELRVAPIAVGRNTTVSITVTDARGVPVRDAEVSVVALHNARSGNRLEATLAPDSTGTEYLTMLAITRPGLWEFRCAVTRGADRFVSSERVDVVRAPITTAQLP